MAFVFKSNNSHGTNPVRKVVSYSKFMRHGKLYYNIEFGDFKFDIDDLDDRSITDNGDMRKVLRTVVATLDIFFTEFPNDKIHIDGSDPIRHAYYHKLIRDHLTVILKHYQVQGYVENRIEKFRINVEYDFIIVSKR